MKKCWGARGKKSLKCFCDKEKSVGGSGYVGSSVVDPDPGKNERGDK